MQFAPPRRKRRLVSLTPMIDVVFLLLVFFMLASKFSVERTLTLTGAPPGAASGWSGAPRLLEVYSDRLSFNGAPVALRGLGGALQAAGARPGQAILLRARDGADVQRLTDVLDALAAAGYRDAALTP